MPSVFLSMNSTVNRIFHFSYANPDYPISGIIVIGLARFSVSVMNLGLEIKGWTRTEDTEIKFLRSVKRFRTWI
jgi:hypothetical protein